ncbi:MAG: PrgI family protein [Patescibacteria group bacterium]
MENHPIPQDITGFQFKLIGDMTIKQFAYLAAGIILGWITYILPIFIIIKIPILVTFVGLGVAAAFLPIEGRPFDVMIGNYFKALLSPTQYIYQKIGGHIWFPDTPIQNQKAAQSIAPSDNAESSRKLKEFLKSLPQKPKNKLDEKEMNFLNSLGFSPTAVSVPVVNSGNSAYEKIISHHDPIIPLQIHPEEKKEPDKNPEPKLNHDETQPGKEPEKAKLPEKVQESLPQYSIAQQELLSQKQNLENQVLELRNKMSAQNQNITTSDASAVKQESQTVRTIPRNMGKTAGLPFMSDVPNLIMGIIKGPRENPLSNILVEVKDTSGNPVRAFKTNALGQFSSATPLGNGTYTISFEDPKSENKFDIIEIKANGDVLMPLEVISLDQREELRRSLFNPAQKS